MLLRHFLFFACVLFPFSFANATQPFRFPEGRHGTGELRYINELPILTVSGTPEEMGEAIGVLALRPGARMASYPENVLKHYHVGFLAKPFLVAGERMVQRFPDEYRRELEAMSRGSGIAREKVVLGNTLFDLKKTLACSALLVEPQRSATNGPLLGRNLDYPHLGYAHEYSLVTVYRPDNAKHAFVSVGFPGLIGCLSGVNDAGLAVSVLEVFQVKAGRKRTDISGLPFALCYRLILENCSTIQEAYRLLETLPRTTINNLVVADRTGVAVFEVTPRRIVVRTATDGLCLCANHFCSPELKPMMPMNLFHTCDRYKVLEKAYLSPVPLDIAALHRHLHAVHQKGTMQTMVFEPATLRLHLAIGTCPSSAGEMKPLDLKPLLSRNEARPMREPRSHHKLRPQPG